MAFVDRVNIHMLVMVSRGASLWKLPNSGYIAIQRARFEESMGFRSTMSPSCKDRARQTPYSSGPNHRRIRGYIAVFFGNPTVAVYSGRHDRGRYVILKKKT